MIDALSPDTGRDVLRRLGFAAPPPQTLAGLNGLYRVWCRNVPFDNVRKRIALARGGSTPLPGGTAEDFFVHWLQHGTGGTCWPTSNALSTLLAVCGFDARRISASMRDMGIPNHGSVIVCLDGQDFLVDSSMLTEAVIPLKTGQRFESNDPVHPVVAEPADRSWLMWFAFTMSTEMMPCRLLADPVDHAFYLDRYEASREMSPFNAALYARRNSPGTVVSFVGSTRFLKTANGALSDDLSADQLRVALRQDLGMSEDSALQCEQIGGG